MPDGPLLFAIAILSVGAFVQSVSGFGMALVATAALPLVMPLHQAIALVAVFNLFVSFVTFWMNRSAFSLGAALPLIVSMCLGIPIGFYFLHAASPGLVIRVLGAVLVAIAVSDLWMSRRGEFHLPKWCAYPLGGTGGVVGGAFNVGGPPIVAFVYSQDWSKAATVAVLQSVFLTAGLTRNALMGAAGDFNREIFIVVAWTLVPAVFAIALGKAILERISKKWLRFAVFSFVLVMGAIYLFWPGVFVPHPTADR